MDESANEKTIDWSLIMDVCGYESLVMEIVALSIKDAGKSVRLLSKAIKAGKSEDVALYAHRLKGVAMTMGATRLSEKAYRFECAGDEKDIEGAALLFDDLRVETEKVISFLSRNDWMEVAKQQENSQSEKSLQKK